MKMDLLVTSKFRNLAPARSIVLARHGLAAQSLFGAKDSPTVDINGQRNLNSLADNEDKQVQLSREGMFYDGRRGTDGYWDYALGFANCGTWAKHVVQASGLPWHYGINNGFGTGGFMGFTLIPLTTSVGATVMGEAGHILGGAMHIGYDTLMPPY